MVSKNDQGNESLSAELRQLQKQLHSWIHSIQADNARLRRQIKKLQQQLKQTETERQAELTAREEDRERWQRERAYLVINLLQKMGKGRPFIPDMLERLVEADSTLTARDVLAEFKRWIRDVSGQRLSRFPAKDEAPGGYITLTPDELTNRSQEFDVGHERPFANKQKRVTFQVVRKGWQLGTQILHPARLSASGIEKRSITKEE